MTRVLVTGGAGSLGSALCHLLLERDPACIVESLDCDENRSAHLRRAIDSPRLVVRVGDVRRAPLHVDTARIYHLAARKHVQFARDDEAREINVGATRRLLETGIPMVFASTDKAADPCLEYGAAKREAEDAVVAAGGWTLRLCNLWLSNGSLPAIIQREVADGVTPVRVPAGIVRHYVDITRAAELLLEVAALEAGRYAIDLDRCPPLSMRQAATLLGAREIVETPRPAGEKGIECSVGANEVADVVSPWLLRVR